MHWVSKKQANTLGSLWNKKNMADSLALAGSHKNSIVFPARLMAVSPLFPCALSDISKSKNAVKQGTQSRVLLFGFTSLVVRSAKKERISAEHVDNR